ncbi:hypothetical protein CERSUDRAFT_43286 [Gelatoporia subvermispora B]|uniref:FAD-binding PCMH-type domain-containing protein n=1 Tax=Ceriporiopsis subvermispora (strain B) TaxID=914234 RepID=M2PX03_CERS8|nr:hypothetical protein CERSUDRAFT_43286 [Gelatoporia subvermispora B]
MSDLLPLRNEFLGDLVTPSDPDYEQAISRWSRNASRRANVVAFPKNANDVAAAISYSKRANLPLAIRGGGHSTSGASSSEGGLVIDLSRYLNGVKVDPEQRRVYVGGGAIWETVDRTTIQHGLATVGGTVNHVIYIPSRLTLGGGFGWLSGRHGLAVDNLIQATIVTADGSIITASASENEELFWGIRGGGCNFGVCTEFVFKLHAQRTQVYAGLVIFSADRAAQVASAVQTWWKNGASEDSGLILFVSPEVQGQPCVMAQLFYNGSEAEGREYYKGLFDIGPIVDMTKEIPYEQLNGTMNVFAPHGRNYYLKGGLVPPEYDLTQHLLEVLDSVIRLSSLGKQPIQAQFEMFPLQAISRVKNDATAFPRSTESNVLITSVWDEESPEKFQFARDAASQLLRTAIAAGATGYGNYSIDALPADGTVSEDKAQQLFGDNYPRLQVLKKRYDPELIFNKWFAITPANVAQA